MSIKKFKMSKYTKSIDIFPQIRNFFIEFQRVNQVFGNFKSLSENFNNDEK